MTDYDKIMSNLKPLSEWTFDVPADLAQADQSIGDFIEIAARWGGAVVLAEVQGYLGVWPIIHGLEDGPNDVTFTIGCLDLFGEESVHNLADELVEQIQGYHTDHKKCINTLRDMVDIIERRIAEPEVE